MSRAFLPGRRGNDAARIAMRNRSRQIRARGIAAFRQSAQRRSCGGRESRGHGAQIGIGRMAQCQRAQPDGALRTRLRVPRRCCDARC